LLAFLALSAAMTGGASASSFVTVAPPLSKSTSFVYLDGASPSIVIVAAREVAERQAAAERGEVVVPLAYPLPYPELQTKRRQLSASIVAYEVPEPGIGFEMVAAVPPARPQMVADIFRLRVPQVIRGGIEGTAFPGSSAPVPAATSGAPSPVLTSAPKTGNQRKQTPAERQAPPVAVAPPPPPSSVPKVGGLQ